MVSEVLTWKQLAGLAVELCGGQDVFRRQCTILKRLVKQYGAKEVESMLRGALILKKTEPDWNLVSLGSAEGSGRRKAREAYFATFKKGPAKLPEDLKAIMRRMFE
jgi:hypothetical protein